MHCKAKIDGELVSFDSRTERDLALDQLSECRYHVKEDRLDYTVMHWYEPDFCMRAGSGKELLLEVKGFMRVGDTQKYKYINLAAKEAGKELVFVLYAKGKALPGARKRKKCGTKRTIEEYLEGLGIKYFYVKDKELYSKLKNL